MQTGKTVAQHTYWHIEASPNFPADQQERIAQAIALTGVEAGRDFNVVKLSQDGGLSLLDYPGFFDLAFPVLRRYWTVDLVQGTFRFRSYEGSLNPPILHRKELLLPKDHPSLPTFVALTQAAEQIGLFDDPRRIGFLQAWQNLLAAKGYQIVDHDLVPIGNDEATDQTEPTVFNGVARHLTALNRSNLSAPVQTLARFGLLDGSKSVFDYGCGRGGDVRGLTENGITVGGWDPYYAPDQPKFPAQIVNLGFVVNVIEDRQERLEALLGAFGLAEELLVVSAMLANPEAVRGKPYGDGVLTSRNTFQKYYTQAELREWLAEALDAEPLAVGPGIFYVFKSPELEQRFQLGRQENRRNVLRYTALSRPAKLPRLPGEGRGEGQEIRNQRRYQAHAELLETLWETHLRLGRLPDKSEIPQPEPLTQAFGSVAAALRFIQARKDNAEAILEQARDSRMDDLKVYFANVYFQQRKPYKHLETGLQRDVKAFFGDYRNALEAGQMLLFAAAHPETLDQACRDAAELGLGWLEEIPLSPPLPKGEATPLIPPFEKGGSGGIPAAQSLQLHTRLIPQLPAVLRAYINCGLKLYGDAESADLIKIHIRSGKLTLMRFDDFLGSPLPRMVQRVKLKLRDQDFDLFDYSGEFEPPYLYRKSLYLNEEMPNYAEQLAFDEALENLNLFDLEGYGPKPKTFDTQLEAARWAIAGFNLVRSQTIPDLDTLCGQHFTYRNLIECGETQAATGLPNLPKQAGSYTALCELAKNIIDPVIDYFGMVRLTYGFCSPELARKIPGRIAPKLDQHAACERNRKGEPVCPRLGAAVDFIIEDEDMEEVTRWIIRNLPYDRLYFYGKDRPIHVSYSENPAKEAWEMREVDGRRVPKAFR